MIWQPTCSRGTRSALPVRTGHSRLTQRQRELWLPYQPRRRASSTPGDRRRHQGTGPGDDADAVQGMVASPRSPGLLALACPITRQRPQQIEGRHSNHDDHAEGHGAGQHDLGLVIDRKEQEESRDTDKEENTHLWKHIDNKFIEFFKHITNIFFRTCIRKS
jgi:hypothetical protein